MNKRHFIKTIGLGGAALTIAPGLLSGCIEKNENPNIKNWLWLHSVGDTSHEELKIRLEKAKKHGIDAVLMETTLEENFALKADGQPLNHPGLERLIQAGKVTGVEVHGWLWQMPNNYRAIAELHPNWFAVNGNGKPSNTHSAYVDYYKFMCPNNPEVQEYLRLRVKSLAAVNGLAGVHLDYIRLPDVILAEALQPKYNITQDKEYPQYDYCYCDICRKKFKGQTGKDPLTDIKEPSQDKEWRQFRYDSITNLVNKILAPEARKADKQITAAVFPNWENVRQEWRNWELDGYFPMLYQNFYNKGINWIGEQIKKEVNELRIKKPVYSGLFLPSLTPEELKQAYNTSIASGAAGVSLFGDISDEQYKVLAELKIKK